MDTSRKNRIIKITIWVVCSIVIITALLVAAAFFWPATSKQLQSSSSEKLSYNDAIAAAIALLAKTLQIPTLDQNADRLLKPTAKNRQSRYDDSWRKRMPTAICRPRRHLFQCRL